MNEWCAGMRIRSNECMPAVAMVMVSYGSKGVYSSNGTCSTMTWLHQCLCSWSQQKEFKYLPFIVMAIIF